MLRLGGSKMNFYNIESKSAKESFEHNNALPYEEFMKMLENADNNSVIGAKVIEKSPCGRGLWLTFGHETRAFLDQRRCDIKRKYRFIESAEIGSYINVHIISKADDSVFFVSRDTIVRAAQDFHKQNSIGGVITGTVLEVTDSFAEIELGAGATAALHVSKIRDAFVQSLKQYFEPGQTVSVLVEGWSDEFDGFILKYEGIRQPCGLKPDTVVQACVTELLEGKKCKCSFPDYPLAAGIIVHIPKGFVLNEGSSMIPVTVKDIRKNIAICEF